MDWNWFFSAVAQCTAAIVGIFGAFIITKIINKQVKYNNNVEEINNFINKSLSLKDKAKIIRFDWYNDMLNKRKLKKIKNSIEKGDEILKPEQYYHKYYFSLYDEKKKIIQAIEEVIKNTRSLTHQESMMRTIQYAATSTNGDALHLESINRYLKEKEKIKSLETEIKDNIRLIEHFLAQIKSDGNISGSRLLTFSIIGNLILFLFGVIYPLSFLPCDDIINLSFSLQNILHTFLSIKGLILSIIGLIFSGMMITFLIINIKLNYDENKLKKLRTFCRINKYSPYYKNMIDNKKFLKEYQNSD